MIEEIGYYYAPFIDYFKDELRPIFEAGRTVKEELEKAIKIFKDSDKELHIRCETEFEALETTTAICLNFEIWIVGKVDCELFNFGFWFRYSQFNIEQILMRKAHNSKLNIQQL